jgi:hypothetical protein
MGIGETKFNLDSKNPEMAMVSNNSKKNPPLMLEDF